MSLVRRHDSITQMKVAGKPTIVLAGSHGGVFSALVAAARGARAVVLHDAGVGLDRAGVVGLDLLETVGAPAAAVCRLSARIGDSADMLARGMISHANATAMRVGVEPGQSVALALAALEAVLDWTPQPRRELPAPTEKSTRIGALRLCDSASMIELKDAGAIVVTGSHGGMPGRSDAAAAKVQIRLGAYNDAGGGVDEAGFERLRALQRRGIAGVTVDAFSARIGEARSSLETGVISRANAIASALGARSGCRLRDFLEQIGALAAREGAANG